NQAIREVEAFIMDINNDVRTGYYPTTNVGCTHDDADGPDITPSGGSIGARGDCIFLGRLLHIAPGGVTDREQKVEVYTIIGNRRSSVAVGADDASTLGQAKPIISPLVVETVQFSEVISFKELRYGGGN